MTTRILLLFAALALSSATGFSQSAVTAEDSASAGAHATSIGGYGNAFYSHDANAGAATMNLERVVLFVGHSFNQTTSVFTELEVEDAKVSGGEPGGEVAFEQAYLKFNLTPRQYLVAGLFIPRIGILNEDHLPTSFNGNERNVVETQVLPATWREIGVGLYGSVAEFNYSAAILNGLNSAGFSHGNGIREGRAEGRAADANNLAVTGSLQWIPSNIKIQASGYYGGTVGLPSHQADSLFLQSGPFGSPVAIGEIDAEYETGRLKVKGLATLVSIPKAYEINRAYANNTPSREYGAYLECAWNLHPDPAARLWAFGRFETLDLNDAIPANGIMDGTLRQQHYTFGLTWLPSPNVCVKTDFRFTRTGELNPGLIVNPNPLAPPYKSDNTVFTLGVGYAF